jgi:hypothetical protein
MRPGRRRSPTRSAQRSTEIAGVIMLSPRNSDAPKIPSAASASFVRRLPDAGRRINVISARIPKMLSRLTATGCGSLGHLRRAADSERRGVTRA